MEGGYRKDRFLVKECTMVTFSEHEKFTFKYFLLIKYSSVNYTFNNY